MAQAFHARLADEFLLLSPSRREDSGFGAKFQWRRLDPPESRSLRYLKTITVAFMEQRSRCNTVVFTRDTPLAFVMAVTGRRVVYEAHDRPHWVIPSLLLRLLAKHPRFKMVAISRALANYYRLHYGLAENKLLVAHDGVFTEQFSATRHAGKDELKKQLRLPLDKVIVVHTGSLYVGRGGELFEHVIRDREDVLFVQVGGEREDINRLREYYESRRIGNILFIPRQSQETVRKYQCAADLLFYMLTRTTPTHWCCSPLKLFEYLASGTPILGARIGSVAEVLNETNAFCFDPDHPDTIQEAFARFLSDSEKAKCQANVAVREATEVYSWHVRAQSILNFALLDEPGV